jgi:hypothetical protein
MTDVSGDVVCVGIIERGQVVDWSSDGREPDPAKWIEEAEFADILRVSVETGVPVLSKLDLYAQTRLSPSECTRILDRWNGVEAALRGTRAEAPAAALRGFMQLCADGMENVELLIEGP